MSNAVIHVGLFFLGVTSLVLRYTKYGFHLRALYISYIMHDHYITHIVLYELSGCLGDCAHF